ncbi:hypothetical protein [Bradyrhizobium sp. RT10b]|uniref:hypothetical protein n=1 Tax=Bradyrhizobium sp. RT10b TaxID=3156331 RepID=UPI0033970814
MNWKERAQVCAISAVVSAVTSLGMNLYMARHPIVLHPKAAINAVEDITKLDALPTLDHGAALDKPSAPMCPVPTITAPAGPATAIGSTLSVTAGPLVITVPLATETPTAAPAAEPVLPAVVAEPVPVAPVVQTAKPVPAVAAKPKSTRKHRRHHHRRAPCACICHPEF